MRTILLSMILVSLLACNKAPDKNLIYGHWKEVKTRKASVKMTDTLSFYKNDSVSLRWYVADTLFNEFTGTIKFDPEKGTLLATPSKTDTVRKVIEHKVLKLTATELELETPTTLTKEGYSRSAFVRY